MLLIGEQTFEEGGWALKSPKPGRIQKPHKPIESASPGLWPENLYYCKVPPGVSDSCPDL